MVWKLVDWLDTRRIEYILKHISHPLVDGSSFMWKVFYLSYPKKKTYITDAIMTSEFIALASTSKEAKWFKKSDIWDTFV